MVETPVAKEMVTEAMLEGAVMEVVVIVAVEAMLKVA